MATEHEILIRHHDEILALAQTASGQGFYVLFIAKAQHDLSNLSCPIEDNAFRGD